MPNPSFETSCWRVTRLSAVMSAVQNLATSEKGVEKVDQDIKDLILENDQREALHFFGSLTDRNEGARNLQGYHRDCRKRLLD